MHWHRYHGFDEHVREHSDLVWGLDRVVYEFEAKPNAVSEDTLDFLKHWLVDHVKGYDIKFELFLRGERCIVTKARVYERHPW